MSVSTPLPYAVHQRNAGIGDIPVSGTCDFQTRAIEASFNGGAYQTIATSSDGSFSGVLTNQTQGQGSLSVRFVGKSTTTIVPHVGIGDIFAVFGDSNSRGFTQNAQQYAHATLKACCFDRDDLTWGEYATSADSAGSVWPLVSSLHMASTGVPVGFCNSGLNSSSVIDWQPGDTLYTIMEARIVALGGSIRAGLCAVGGRDAQNGLSQLDYANYLSTIADNFYAQYGVPLVVANVGHENLSIPANVQKIRLGQKDVWASEPVSVRPGPSLYDVLFAHDGTHWYSDADLELIASRWWAAINAGLFGATGGRGPQLVSASRSAGNTVITLTFAGDNLPLAVSTLAVAAFTVRNDGTPVTISTAARTGSDTITLALAGAANGVVTVSLGEGENGYNVAVPADTGTPSLPAEMFVNFSVT